MATAKFRLSLSAAQIALILDAMEGKEFQKAKLFWDTHAQLTPYVAGDREPAFFATGKKPGPVSEISKIKKLLLDDSQDEVMKYAREATDSPTTVEEAQAGYKQYLAIYKPMESQGVVTPIGIQESVKAWLSYCEEHDLDPDAE